MGAAAAAKTPKLPRVLLVDADNRIANITAKDLSLSGFEVIKATGMGQGWSELQSKQIDLVLLEPMVGSETGYELMEKIQTDERFAGMPIIILTSMKAKQAVQRCKDLGASEYVVKPFKPDTLVQHIKRALKLNDKMEVSQAEVQQRKNASVSRRKSIQTIIAKLQKGEIEFPALPEVGLKVIDLMKDENKSFNEIADLIAKEPGISTKLIKVANSSAFNRGGKPIVSTKEAIMRLGMQQTMNTVLLIVNSQVFEIKNPILAEMQRTLWKHAITAAVYSKYIGKEIGYSRPDAMFAFGLLHDIGKVMLLRVMQDMSADKATESTESINATMAKLHTELGPMLLQRWNFPPEFVEVAKQHHDAPNKDKHSKPVLVVSMANVVAHEYENGLSAGSIEAISKVPHFEILKLKTQSFERVQESVIAELESMLSILNG